MFAGVEPTRKAIVAASEGEITLEEQKQI